MDFDKYINSVIEDFASDCISAGFIDDLNHEHIKEIKEKFKEHKVCFESKSDFDNENLDIMESVVYGDYDNVAIECNQCNTIIVDSIYVEGDE